MEKIRIAARLFKKKEGIIKWTDVKMKIYRERTNTVLDYIKRAHLRWLGHVAYRIITTKL